MVGLSVDIWAKEREVGSSSKGQFNICSTLRGKEVYYAGLSFHGDKMTKKKHKNFF